MSFWNPDKECDRDTSLDYYSTDNEILKLKAEVKRLQRIIEQQNEDRIKLATC